MHTSFLVEHEAEAADLKVLLTNSPAAVRFEGSPRARSTASLKKPTFKERMHEIDPASEVASLNSTEGANGLNETSVSQAEEACFEQVVVDDVKVLVDRDPNTSLTAVSVL